MSRVLMAWELGENLGHITRLLILARALRECGHAVVFALRDIRGGAQVLHQQGFAFLQAPVPSVRAAGITGDPASYPEILMRSGFGDAEGLVALAHAWRNLYGLVRPDAIVFDHSPAALLAAHGTGVSRILFGTGFGSPPRIYPMPSFRPWERTSTQRLDGIEWHALANANAALRAIQARPLAVLHQLFEVEEDILATLPELDHYRGRTGARYWGPVYDAGAGDKVLWPVGQGKKLFVYLRPDSPAFVPIAAMLQRTKYPTLWFSPGLPLQAVQQLQTQSLHFLLKPPDITRIAASADSAILYAVHGMTAAMLLGGIPMLLIPQNLEQFLVASNAAALGAVAILPPILPGTRVVEHVSQFLGIDSYRARAQAFATKYKDFDQGKQLAGIVARIEKLLDARAASASAARIEVQPA